MASTSQRPQTQDASRNQRRWAREYLPGYTGHVPTKNELFGKTAGSINKEICLAGGRTEDLNRLQVTTDFAGRSELPVSSKINKDVYGNHSKAARNWICGPTHEMRMQHIPHYKGHVRGMVNKDFISKSYARVTAQLFARNHPIPDDTDVKSRFTSSQRFEYRPSNFRRFADNKQMVPCKDYDDYTKFVNESHAGRKNNLLQKTQRLNSAAPATTHKKRNAESDPHAPLRTQTASGAFGNKRNHSVDPRDHLNSTMVKPKIVESKVSQKEDFFQLSDGFKSIFGNDKKDRKMVIPVVGYGGHRRGDRSQNFFGRSFRDTTIQSKSIERGFRGASLAV